MAGWLGDHLGEAVTIAAVIVGQIVAYARLMYRSDDHSQRLLAIERMLLAHTSDTAAHRNPDFERRLLDLSSTLEEIRVDVKKLLREE